MKKFLILFGLLFISSCIFLNANNAFAEDTVEILDTGKCGDDIKWTMYADYTLELSGTGGTYDYNFADSGEVTDLHHEVGFPSWYAEYQNNIKKIVIHEGITRIGDFAFCGSYGSLETIDMPDSIEEVGYFALATVGYFGDNTAHKINAFPENLRIIDDGGFFGITFSEKITLPEKVDSIGSLAFNSEFKEYVIPANVSEISELAFGFADVFSDDDKMIDNLFESIEQKQCDKLLDTLISDSDVCVYGYRNTIAETYANENGFTFIALDDDPGTTITTTDVTTITTDTTTTTTDSTKTTTEISTTSDEEPTATTNKSETTSTTTTIGTTLSMSETTIETTTTATTRIASDEELCDWAVKDYEDKTGVTPASAEIEYTADDTAIITLIDAEGNVLDVYNIDPFTGIGTEADGGDVNLPQTGYSNFYKVIVWFAILMTITGVAIVAYSRKESE